MNSVARYIRVFDKNNRRIAEFSNFNAAEGRGQKDNMASPTITIVSNGESTLSFDMLAQSEKWNQIKNPEYIYECNDRQYTALNKNSIVNDGNAVHVTLVETWYLLGRVYVQAHNVNTKIEAIDEHTVKILPKTDPKFKLTVNGVEYDDSEVVDSRGVRMPRGSAGYALWAILKGTDWKLGVCDVLPNGFDPANDYGTFNIETDMKSALENIQAIQSLYGGILDWDSKNKTLSLRDETKEGSDFNKWKGFSIRKNKNLAAPAKVTWDNDIITRLYPLGNGNLNIKKVNGGKSYIENFSYTNKVYEAYEQNANIYDTGDESGQKTLKFWAEQQLAKKCKPRKSIAYEVVDMRGTKEYEFETFDINDIVKAYFVDDDSGKEKWEFVRIKELSYNYFHPSIESTVIVGDKVADTRELFHQVYKRVENSAPTDDNGNLSGDDIVIEIPEFLFPDFGFAEGDFGYASLSKITELYAYHTSQNKDGIINAEAGIKVVADNLKAQIDAFTAFEKKTNDSFAQSSTLIQQISDELHAQITLEANHYRENKEGIKASNARIDIVASDLQASINLETSHYNETKNRFNETNARITVLSDNFKSQVTLDTQQFQKLENGIQSSNARIDAVSTSLEAQITLEAKHYQNTTDKITASDAKIKVLSDNLQAQINLEAQHYRETKDSFSKSDARLTLLSSDISAQVKLEAQHYQETKESISTSVAGLRTYVDGDFARAQMSAANTYTDQKTGEVSKALAEFKSYVNGSYATNESVAKFATKDELNSRVSQSEASIKQYANSTFATNASVARFVTMDQVNGRVSQSEASIKQYASSNFASVSITADVRSINSRIAGLDLQGGSGFVKVMSGYVKIGIGGKDIMDFGTGQTTVYSNFAVSASHTLYATGGFSFKGKTAYWDNKGYLRGR